MGWRQTAFCLQTSLIIYFEVHYLLLNFTKTENPGLKRFLNIAIVLVCLAACIFFRQDNRARTVDRSSFQMYRNYIEWEQGLPLTVDEKGVVSLGDSPIDSYTFRKDYYFVAGDKADNSRDSRYWGLLPRDHIAAKAWIIKKSVDPVSGKCRYGRIGKKVE